MRRLWCSLTVIVAVSLLPGEAVASGGGGCYGPIKDRPGPEVRMKNFCFDPAVVRIPKGDEVTWTNLDESKHNIYAGPLWGTRTLREYDETTVRFDRAGIFTYVCNYHPAMVGTVVVGDGYSGPVIGGKDAGIKVTDFVRAEPKKTADLSDTSDTGPLGMQAVAAEADPVAAAEASSRSSLWGPLIALLVIAALCLFALVTGRSVRRREPEDKENILRK